MGPSREAVAHQFQGILSRCVKQLSRLRSRTQRTNLKLEDKRVSGAIAIVVVSILF